MIFTCHRCRISPACSPGDVDPENGLPWGWLAIRYADGRPGYDLCVTCKQVWSQVEALMLQYRELVASGLSEQEAKMIALSHARPGSSS